MEPLKDQAAEVLSNPPVGGWPTVLAAAEAASQKIDPEDAKARGPRRVLDWLRRDMHLRKLLVEYASGKLLARLKSVKK